MGGKNKNAEMRGPAGFESYYSSLFGSGWETLRTSLMDEVKYVQVECPGCRPYFMDGASVCAALCLPVKNASDVLDMCAAPGGKSIILARNLNDSAFLTLNERSPERKARLCRVIDESLPRDVQERIRIKCSDGATWCRRETECFDSILLDAPCSSERHVLNDARYLSQWSPSRIKSLAVEQWSLLSCAWRLLRKDGFLLYSTCALSPDENDAVVSRLFRKFSDASPVPEDEIRLVFSQNILSLSEACAGWENLEKVLDAAVRTECGFHLLPDRTGGAGPIYFSLLHKRL